MSMFIKHVFWIISLRVMTIVKNSVRKTIPNGVLEIQNGCISIRVMSIL